MSHPDRERAESFGADAQRYDRARPGYPQALADDLLAAGAHDVLDIGCGTGSAGRLFAARGCQVLGVEPDPRMAAVARGHGLDVEVARFENWKPAGRTFDLLVCGQAWHWVDPAAGLPKAAGALRPGGLLTMFWNSVTHPPPVMAALEAAYQAHAPELLSNNVALGTLPDLTGPDPDATAASGQFGEPADHRYAWDRTYTPEQLIDELPTHSIHRPLTPARLASLLTAIETGLAEIGTFTTRIQTTAFTVRRREFPRAH
jgi:SAM-dependent methyltransferase